MRKEDLMKLQTAYPHGQESAADDRFARALDVSLPRLRELADAIFTDFNETTFGVGWWAAHSLGAARRILISDHLHECAISVETNLVEAKLHLLEYVDAAERESHFVRNAVTLNADCTVKSLKFPPRLKPADDLARHLVALHEGGFARAIGSALDCLGGVIVGVLGLKTSLLRADINRAREVLGKVDPNAGPETSIQVDFARTLEAAIVSAGPDRWLDWATDFRNMLVHRGRRLHLTSIEPRGNALFDHTGHPVGLVRAIPQMPRDPALSDVEVLLSDVPPVLEEEAETTMRGALRSTLALAEAMSARLASVWSLRRATPALIEQPREQWKTVPSAPLSPFAGYDRASLPYDPKVLAGNPDLLRRLRCAALEDGSRPRWKDFAP
jgi:hypothetical protein